MKSVFILFTIFTMCSCSQSYNVQYQSHLENSPSKSLSFEDSVFKFIFIPTSNGVGFTIENKSNKTQYINWDKSYFIMPNGNSFKALNTDLLTSELASSQKYSNETSIPSKSKLTRFTTSINNLDFFRQTKFRSFQLPSKEFITLMETNEFLNVGNYWLNEFEIETNNTDKNKKDKNTPTELLNSKCSEISDEIKNNNYLGLGLYIRSEKKEVEYRFSFKVDQIFIYEVTEKLKLVRISSLQSGWECYSPPN